MFSMVTVSSSTSVVRAFSYGDVNRPSSSSGLRPVYLQPIETTGILMLGKMPAGVRKITTGAAMRINSARTINVYGRLRATLAIHILSYGAPFCCDDGGVGLNPPRGAVGFAYLL